MEITLGHTYRWHATTGENVLNDAIWCVLEHNVHKYFTLRNSKNIYFSYTKIRINYSHVGYLLGDSGA